MPFEPGCAGILPASDVGRGVALSIANAAPDGGVGQLWQEAYNGTE